jgi:hypothetical protein
VRGPCIPKSLVASGILPDVEPGILPGGSRAGDLERGTPVDWLCSSDVAYATSELHGPVGTMPTSTAAQRAAATFTNTSGTQP